MNIDELLKALLLVQRSGLTGLIDSSEKADCRRVLVRGDRSGVFYGRLVSENGQTVELTEVRHVWSWTGALNVADLAAHGPSGGKITAPIARIRVLDAIEICDVDDAAASRFEAVKAWTK